MENIEYKLKSTQYKWKIYNINDLFWYNLNKD